MLFELRFVTSRIPFAFNSKGYVKLHDALAKMIFFGVPGDGGGDLENMESISLGAS